MRAECLGNGSEFRLVPAGRFRYHARTKQHQEIHDKTWDGDTRPARQLPCGLFLLRERRTNAHVAPITGDKELASSARRGAKDIKKPYNRYHDNKADDSSWQRYSSPVSSNSPRIGFAR
jgi:hypothetical protein